MNKTRALERDEIHRLFGCVSGRYAPRNRTMLICGIAMALRATELCQLNVGDVLSSTDEVKRYVTIRKETAKFNKGRTIRQGDFARETLSAFLAFKQGCGESLAYHAPLFCSQKGGHLDRTQLFRVVSSAMRKAGT